MPSSKPSSLTAETYAHLRAEILACRLRPGTKLVISDLCKKFGFGLGAVREALSRLASEGLVIAEPHKGFSVTPVTQDELEDVTRVRVTIETLCLENAIANGDLRWETGIVSSLFELSRIELHDDKDPGRVSEDWARAHERFHAALVAACDSPTLLRIRELLYAQSERYRRFSVPLDTEKRDLGAEHRAIADAAIARDSKRASAELRAHLEKTTRILLVSGVGAKPRQSPAKGTGPAAADPVR